MNRKKVVNLLNLFGLPALLVALLIGATAVNAAALKSRFADLKTRKCITKLAAKANKRSFSFTAGRRTQRFGKRKRLPLRIFA